MNSAVKSGRAAVRPVTLKVVAERAECSISQASAVLNHSQGGTVVSKAKREKIRRIAEELGYRLNFASHALKKNKTDTIGIYLEPSRWRSLCNVYELSVYRGIEAAATARDYDLLIFNLANEVSPRICERKLGESRCDGVILIKTSNRTDWIERLVDRGHKLVAVECGWHIPGVSRVMLDEEAAIRLAISKLAEKGHRRIGFLGLGLECTAGIPPRNEIFARCIGDFDCDRDGALIFDRRNCPVEMDITMEFCQLSGRMGLRYFAGLAHPPTAVIAHDSLVALAALQEASRCGVNIPRDMSLVGIDDYEIVSLFQPQLTVVDHRLHELGEKAVQLLISQIEDGDQCPADGIVQPEWIERETVSTRESMI